MSEQSLQTRSRIMEVARILFADHGFEGTSVREIAKAADVNVASVNYHFLSKENLYSEILRLGYINCSQTMRNFYDTNQPNLEETVLFLFKHFNCQSHDVVTHYKIVLSAQHSHHATSQGTEDAPIGPPGGKVLTEALQKEVGKSIPDKDLLWGMRVLFTNVVHFSLMYNCCYKQQNIPFTTLEDLEDSIKRLARLVVADLRALPV